MNISLAGREAESINPLETARSSDPIVIINYLIHTQWLGVHVCCFKIQTKLLGLISTREIFSVITTKKQSNRKKPPINCKLALERWMNSLCLSAMNMCFPGNRKQKSPAEVVQPIWVNGKRNIYSRRWRKHCDAEHYGFITEEETIRSYKTTQCTSLLMIHKIKHHSPNSHQQLQCDIFPCQVWLIFFSR